MSPSASTHSNRALFVRTLMPSLMGVIIYLLVAISLVGLHLVQASLSGKAYPMELDDYLLQGYANFVIRPLAVVVNHDWFNTALTVILWGSLGWALFAVLSWVASSIAQWRNTAHDIAAPREGIVIAHPLERTLLLRICIRLVIALTALALLMVVVPVVQYCLDNDYRILASDSLPEAAHRIGTNVLCLMTLFHPYVVLLRLYMFRTRVFGELIY